MGSIIGGMTQIFTALPAAAAAQQANNDQYNRERVQADTAISQAQEQGAYASGRARIQGGQLAAKQRTAYADSGVDATTGTAAQVQSNTAALSELDAQQASINSAKQVWGYKMSRQQDFQDFSNRQATNNNNEEGAILGGFSKYIGGIAGSMGGGG